MKVGEMTDYAKAWKQFVEGEQYAGCIKELTRKGIRSPYASNILRIAFDAAWNSKPSK